MKTVGATENRRITVSDKTKKSDPKLMKKIYVSVSLLLIAVILMIAVSYAWIALSTAPEVIGVNTSITGNGSLEIALMPSTGLFSGITSGRGASADYAGGVQELTKANNSWGNIINLNDTVYGLDLITLRPARLNYDPQTGFVGDSILSTPEWSADGRITALRGTLTASHYTDDDFAVGPGFSGDRYGVRAVLDVDNDTYGFITDLAFRINTESELGQAGKLLLQTYGAQRIYSGSDEEATLGKGSCFSFIDEFGNDIENYSKTYAKKYLECLRLAFIRDYGNAEADESSVIAFARANTESGELYICDKNGSIIKGEDANVIIPAMEKNRAYQVSVLVWLDGNAVTSANMTVSQRILNKASLNLQFATDVELVPADIIDISAPETFDRQKCGDDATWSIDENGVLVIEGEGAIYDYAYGGQTPWNLQKASIKKIIIGDEITAIGDNAFYGCENVSSVILPNSVTDIGDKAFYHCNELSDIYYSGTSEEFESIIIGDNNDDLTDSVIYSGDGNVMNLDSNIIDSGKCGTDVNYTLYDNGLLTISGTGNMNNYVSLGCNANIAPWNENKDLINTIIINDGITSIGGASFADCKNLDYIYIADSVTSIGDSAFNGCTSLTTITVPDSVTNVGNGAFYGCNNLQYNEYNNALYLGNENNPYVILIKAKDTLINNVVMNENTIIIYDKAFNGYSNLTKITIPDSVKSIGNSAFNGCTGLTSITIPDSVTNIGGNAFHSCTGLTSATIGSSVTSIGDGAFYKCTGLTSINIPDSVTSIGNSAFFDCTGLTSATIGSSVTSIGDSAFYNCTGLTSINIPDSVTSIGGSAFSGCYGLTSITIPDSVTSIGNYAFYCCYGLTSATIGSSVTSIGNNAFYGCFGLTSINIPDSVTSIGNYAFHGCTDLTSINIPDSVTSIGEYAFYRCTGLTSVTIGNGVASIGQNAFYNCTDLTSATIGSSVKIIGQYAFSKCTGLTSINIPDSVTSIGGSAFYGCTGLTSITVSSGNTVYHSNGNCLINTAYKTLILGCKNSVIPSDGSVKSIGERAFYGCTGLTSINIPDSVTSIGDSAFYGCTGLTSITIPDSVTSIGSSAFWGCTGLTSINIPDSVTSIGNTAFSGCSGLTSVTIGSGVKSISDQMFYGCTGLTSINIPDSVMSIGDGAISGCTGLTSINIPDSVTSMDNNAFWGCTGLTSITVSSGNTVYHSSGNCLIQTSDRILLTGCKTSVIPGDGSVTSIGNHAFSGCTGLTSITIPNSITSIGYGAFSNCYGLTSINIPDSVTSIGNNAFYRCTGLTSVTIGSSVTSIVGGAFSGCTSLASINIPDSVTSIGNNAFSGCTGLTSINYNGTKAQWNALSKESNWNSDTGNYTVCCTDGNIPKQ